MAAEYVSVFMPSLRVQSTYGWFGEAAVPAAGRHTHRVLAVFEGVVAHDEATFEKRSESLPRVPSRQQQQQRVSPT